MRGTVYFAITSFGLDDYMKIGWTGGSPQRRLRELQTGCPWPIDLLGEMPGSTADERALHERFAHLCTMGEWFAFDDELLEWFRDHFDWGHRQ